MASFDSIVNLFILLFQIAGGMIIVWGGARTVYYLFLPGLYPLPAKKPVSLVELLRVELGQKIVFGLEFMVAGDILATLLRPSMSELYQLAILVVIRTVLSFFVERDVKILDIHQHQVEREMLIRGSGKPQLKK